MAITEHQTFAVIKGIHVPDHFRSDTDDKFTADIEIENKSEFPHSAQVVFRGYVRQKELLFYEFFHEQVWILIPSNESTIKKVSLDVWLPRFPPTMKIKEDLFVEYSVKATVDPWFKNNFHEKRFNVIRSLHLKLPHSATHPKKILVNQCVGHEGWGHRTCKPLNGEVWLEKGAYAAGEHIRVRWRLVHDAAIQHVNVMINEILEHRIPDAGHPMLLEVSRKTLVQKEIQVKNIERDNFCELQLPSKMGISIPMSLWNVISNRYAVLIRVKTAAHKNPVDIVCPIIVASESIEGVSRKKKIDYQLRVRALDRDDDSEDDDDVDSELDEEIPAQDRQYSIDLEKIIIKTEKPGSLKDSYAQIFFEVNSTQPRPLKNLRLLLQGEVRADSRWYEFMRFKAIISTGPTSMFSPGSHSIKISLPFRDSQYDVNMLAPSLGDDVRYVCRASMDSWRKNVVHVERDLFVDRFVDTWAKEEFKTPHKEIMGVNEIFMRQRCFERGKFVFVKLRGDVRKVRLELVQQRRLRVPELKKDESYCYERVVSVYEGKEDPSLWPEEWSIYIPKNLPPSIEITYWNVLVLSYALVVVNTLSDGHQHRYLIPIWIGCTEDKLEPPIQPKKSEMVTKYDPIEEELPEFEVIHPEETHVQPYWVERYDSHTYGYDI